MADQMEELLRATLIRGYDAGPTVDGRELLGGARAARRRRIGSIAAVVAGVVVAAAVTVPLIVLRAGGSASPVRPATSPASTQAPSTWHPFVPFPGMVGTIAPDPRSGRPFADAAQASAASSGAYVPDCPGHTTYYVQPNGEVVTFFHGNDAEMGMAGPYSGLVFGPAARSVLVEPHLLTVHGQTAYGYRAIHDKPEALRVAGRVLQAVMYRSLLEWKQGGSIMTLTSGSELTLSQLTAIANSCH